MSFPDGRADEAVFVGNPYLSLAENMGTLSVFYFEFSGGTIEPLIAQPRPAAFIDGCPKV